MAVVKYLQRILWDDDCVPISVLFGSQFKELVRIGRSLLSKGFQSNAKKLGTELRYRTDKGRFVGLAAVRHRS